MNLDNTRAEDVGLVNYSVSSTEKNQDGTIQGKLPAISSTSFSDDLTLREGKTEGEEEAVVDPMKQQDGAIFDDIDSPVVEHLQSSIIHHRLDGNSGDVIDNILEEGICASQSTKNDNQVTVSQKEDEKSGEDPDFKTREEENIVNNMEVESYKKEDIIAHDLDTSNLFIRKEAKQSKFQEDLECKENSSNFMVVVKSPETIGQIEYKDEKREGNDNTQYIHKLIGGIGQKEDIGEAETVETDTKSVESRREETCLYKSKTEESWSSDTTSLDERSVEAPQSEKEANHESAAEAETEDNDIIGINGSICITAEEVSEQLEAENPEMEQSGILELAHEMNHEDLDSKTNDIDNIMVATRNDKVSKGPKIVEESQDMQKAIGEDGCTCKDLAISAGELSESESSKEDNSTKKPEGEVVEGLEIAVADKDIGETIIEEDVGPHYHATTIGKEQINDGTEEDKVIKGSEIAAADTDTEGIVLGDDITNSTTAAEETIKNGHKKDKLTEGLEELLGADNDIGDPIEEAVVPGKSQQTIGESTMKDGHEDDKVIEESEIASINKYVGEPIIEEIGAQEHSTKITEENTIKNDHKEEQVNGSLVTTGADKDMEEPVQEEEVVLDHSRTTIGEESVKDGHNDIEVIEEGLETTAADKGTTEPIIEEEVKVHPTTTIKEEPIKSDTEKDNIREVKGIETGYSDKGNGDPIIEEVATDNSKTSILKVETRDYHEEDKAIKVLETAGVYKDAGDNTIVGKVVPDHYKTITDDDPIQDCHEENKISESLEIHGADKQIGQPTTAEELLEHSETYAGEIPIENDHEKDKVKVVGELVIAGADKDIGEPIIEDVVPNHSTTLIKEELSKDGLEEDKMVVGVEIAGARKDIHEASIEEDVVSNQSTTTTGEELIGNGHTEDKLYEELKTAAVEDDARNQTQQNVAAIDEAMVLVREKISKVGTQENKEEIMAPEGEVKGSELFSMKGQTDSKSEKERVFSEKQDPKKSLASFRATEFAPSEEQVVEEIPDENEENTSNNHEDTAVTLLAEKSSILEADPVNRVFSTPIEEKARSSQDPEMGDVKHMEISNLEDSATEDIFTVEKSSANEAEHEKSDILVETSVVLTKLANNDSKPISVVDKKAIKSSSDDLLEEKPQESSILVADIQECDTIGTKEKINDETLREDNIIDKMETPTMEATKGEINMETAEHMKPEDSEMGIEKTEQKNSNSESDPEKLDLEREKHVELNDFEENSRSEISNPGLEQNKSGNEEIFDVFSNKLDTTGTCANIRKDILDQEEDPIKKLDQTLEMEKQIMKVEEMQVQVKATDHCPEINDTCSTSKVATLAQQSLEDNYPYEELTIATELVHHNQSYEALCEIGKTEDLKDGEIIKHREAVSDEDHTSIPKEGNQNKNIDEADSKLDTEDQKADTNDRDTIVTEKLSGQMHRGAESAEEDDNKEKLIEEEAAKIPGVLLDNPAVEEQKDSDIISTEKNIEATNCIEKIETETITYLDELDEAANGNPDIEASKEQIQKQEGCEELEGVSNVASEVYEAETVDVKEGEIDVFHTAPVLEVTEDMNGKKANHDAEKAVKGFHTCIKEDGTTRMSFEKTSDLVSELRTGKTEDINQGSGTVEKDIKYIIEGKNIVKNTQESSKEDVKNAEPINPKEKIEPAESDNLEKTINYIPIKPSLAEETSEGDVGKRFKVDSNFESGIDNEGSFKGLNIVSSRNGSEEESTQVDKTGDSVEESKCDDGWNKPNEEIQANQNETLAEEVQKLHENTSNTQNNEGHFLREHEASKDSCQVTCKEKSITEYCDEDERKEGDVNEEATKMVADEQISESNAEKVKREDTNDVNKASVEETSLQQEPERLWKGDGYHNIEKNNIEEGPLRDPNLVVIGEEKVKETEQGEEMKEAEVEEASNTFGPQKSFPESEGARDNGRKTYETVKHETADETLRSCDMEFAEKDIKHADFTEQTETLNVKDEESDKIDDSSVKTAPPEQSPVEIRKQHEDEPDHLQDEIIHETTAKNSSVPKDAANLESFIEVKKPSELVFGTNKMIMENLHVEEELASDNTDASSHTETSHETIREKEGKSQVDDKEELVFIKRERNEMSLPAEVSGENTELEAPIAEISKQSAEKVNELNAQEGSSANEETQALKPLDTPAVITAEQIPIEVTPIDRIEEGVSIDNTNVPSLPLGVLGKSSQTPEVEDGTETQGVDSEVNAVISEVDNGTCILAEEMSNVSNVKYEEGRTLDDSSVKTATPEESPVELGKQLEDEPDFLPDEMIHENTTKNSSLSNDATNREGLIEASHEITQQKEGEPVVAEEVDFIKREKNEMSLPTAESTVNIEHEALAADISKQGVEKINELKFQERISANEETRVLKPMDTPDVTADNPISIEEKPIGRIEGVSIDSTNIQSLPLGVLGKSLRTPEVEDGREAEGVDSEENKVISEAYKGMLILADEKSTGSNVKDEEGRKLDDSAAKTIPPEESPVEIGKQLEDEPDLLPDEMVHETATKNSSVSDIANLEGFIEVKKASDLVFGTNTTTIENPQFEKEHASDNTDSLSLTEASHEIIQQEEGQSTLDDTEEVVFIKREENKMSLPTDENGENIECEALAADISRQGVENVNELNVQEGIGTNEETQVMKSMDTPDVKAAEQVPIEATPIDGIEERVSIHSTNVPSLPLGVLGKSLQPPKAEDGRETLGNDSEVNGVISEVYEGTHILADEKSTGSNVKDEEGRKLDDSSVKTLPPEESPVEIGKQLEDETDLPDEMVHEITPKILSVSDATNLESYIEVKKPSDLIFGTNTLTMENLHVQKELASDNTDSSLLTKASHEIIQQKEGKSAVDDEEVVFIKREKNEMSLPTKESGENIGCETPVAEISKQGAEKVNELNIQEGISANEETQVVKLLDTPDVTAEDQIPIEANPVEWIEEGVSIDSTNVPSLPLGVLGKSLQIPEVEDGREAQRIDSEVNKVISEVDKGMHILAEEKSIGSESSDAEARFSDLLAKSRKETGQTVEQLEGEIPQCNKEESENKEAVIEKIQNEDNTNDKEKDEDMEEEDEHKKDDSGSDAPVIVEASRDIDVKTTPKKSHNIFSGVGSKVKHSIIKVKKAITGKSSHHKQQTPK